MTFYGYIIVHSCIISFNLSCIMQLQQFYNIATEISSRKKCYYFWWSTWLLIGSCVQINQQRLKQNFVYLTLNNDFWPRMLLYKNYFNEGLHPSSNSLAHGPLVTKKTLSTISLTSLCVSPISLNYPIPKGMENTLKLTCSWWTW